MHAALISLVLMSGACSDMPESDPVAVEQITAGPPVVDHFSPDLYITNHITVSRTAPAAPCGCGAHCYVNNFKIPPLYRGCPQYCRPEFHTQPAWQSDYRPAWYFDHRMLFHPADYTQPFPYRERFSYPWNDPRCVSYGPTTCE